MKALIIQFVALILALGVGFFTVHAGESTGIIRVDRFQWFFGTAEEYIKISSSEVSRPYTDSSSSEISRK